MHSSNSVYILQPESATSDKGVTAIAQCEATLETLPQAIVCIPLLKGILPVFSDTTSYASRDAPLGRTRDSILEDMPVSSGEFALAWVALCAFEIDGQAWRPSAAILWKTWKAIMSACTLKGLSLDREIDVQSLSLALNEDGLPEQILYAVIQRIKLSGGPNSAKVDANECVPWVGAVLLQVMSEAMSSVTVSQFIRDWMDQLPESWRKSATLHVLEVSCTDQSRCRMLMTVG